MDAVEAYLAERIAEGRMPGAVWSVSAPEGILSEGAVGHAAIEPERVEATVETLYDLASLTKPLVTALALVMLEQRGSLSLDAPVSESLPEFAGSSYSDCPLLSFAAHTAGLPAWQPLARSGGGMATALREIAATQAGPRGIALYSDLGYIALGAVVERAAGAGLDVWFDESVARPLGLASIGFATRIDCAAAAPTERGNAYERGMAGPSAEASAWREELIRGDSHDGNAWVLGGVAGHAGLFGALHDVVAVVREILAPASGLLGDAARSRLLSEAVPGSGRTVGFALAPVSRAARGVLAADAPGHVGFSGTSVWMEPDAGRAYVLLTNRVHPVVRDEDFQPVRAGFHRVARDLFPAR